MTGCYASDIHGIAYTLSVANQTYTVGSGATYIPLSPLTSSPPCSDIGTLHYEIYETDLITVPSFITMIQSPLQFEIESSDDNDAGTHNLVLVTKLPDGEQVQAPFDLVITASGGGGGGPPSPPIPTSNNAPYFDEPLEDLEVRPLELTTFDFPDIVDPDSDMTSMIIVQADLTEIPDFMDYENN